MVRIADQVWRAWREEAEREVEWSLLMLLSCSVPPPDVERALTETMTEVVIKWDGEHPGRFFGEWSWTHANEGVVVKATESEDFEQALRAVTAGLQRRGLDGVIDVYDPPPIPDRPPTAHLLECRLRVRGERIQRGPHTYTWNADPGALAASVEVAVRWCVDGGRRGELALLVDVMPPLALSPDEDVFGRVIEALDPPRRLELRTLLLGEMRCLALNPSDGRITLIETVRLRKWRDALDGLTGVLMASADSVAYGLIKHGSAVAQAVNDHSLSYDWPPRADLPPGDHQMSRVYAFEDTYAPDAFAIQLLGPGYAGRVPSGPRWRQDTAGNHSVLLRHEDPDAWFDTEFVEYGSDFTRALRAQPPEVLVRAREDLAPILNFPDGRRV
jgi:hypothetical protein